MIFYFDQNSADLKVKLAKQNSQSKSPKFGLSFIHIWIFR